MTIDPSPFPPDTPGWDPATIDRTPREDLTGDDRRIADALDRWLLRTRGVRSADHHSGLFRELLHQQGLTIVPIEWDGDEPC